jgi:hypothetical protein
VANLHYVAMQSEIKGVFVPVQAIFGAMETHQLKEDKSIHTWNHFHVSLPKRHMKTGTQASTINSSYALLRRGLEEIPADILQLVIDLVNQGSLLNGKSYISKVKGFLSLSKEYSAVNNKVHWLWSNVNNKFARFRNELIGTLCTELAEGADLTTATINFNKRVDPANYKKAKAPVTQAQINKGRELVEELGLTEAFKRRAATLDDIRASEILHMNVGDGQITKANIFDDLKPTKKSSRARSKFKDLAEVSIDKFMEEVLPGASAVEVLLENRLAPNLFTMFTAVDPQVKALFNYGNNFSFTTSNNLAGKSELAEMVETRGGRVDGVFRFTHSWNRLAPNKSLMDLHVFLPTHDGHRGGTHDTYGNAQRVGWNNRSHGQTGGAQDVDYTGAAPKGYIPVENITFPSLGKLPEGTYVCKIHNWSFRNSSGPGEAEIAFGGEVYNYVYPATKNKEWITVAEVTLKNGKWSIEHKLEPTNVTKELYGLDTGEFHKVNLVCLSPNHWDKPTGHKHYMFALDGCKADRELRTFHTVDLVPELHDARKVIDYLGNVVSVKPEGKQLSGVCFNATVSDHVIVKVKGSHQRVMKVKFN